MIVFDLDGTLRTIVDKHVPVDPEVATNWTHWQCAAILYGAPTNLARGFYQHNAHRGVILTSSMFGTEAWLRWHGLPQPGHGIIERSPHDDRTSLDLKHSWLEDNHHRVDLWVDDDLEMLACAAGFYSIKTLRA